MRRLALPFRLQPQLAHAHKTRVGATAQQRAFR